MIGKALVVAAALALLGLSVAQAAINIDTVAVGDAGNAADTTGYGSVGYGYRIAKYEVTAAQYTQFLNAVAKTDTYGLYNTQMWSSSSGCKIQQSGNPGSYSYSVASDWANRPVNYVSYWDACRFTNWLHNGQPQGLQNATTTEGGAYTLDGYNAIDGSDIQRNASWQWAVTSEDEWYKAAYYKGGGTTADYWLYPTQSDSAPSNDIADPDGNNACFYYGGQAIGSPYWRTEVGEFQNSDSAYGTFDQAGNVWEWNEAITKTTERDLRGGSFWNNTIDLQATSRSYDQYPTYEQDGIGFRVVAVPEPSSIIALLGGLAGLTGTRRRRR